MSFDENDMAGDLPSPTPAIEADNDFGRPARDAQPLIPEGIYEVQCVGCDKVKRVFGPNEGRIILRYRVTSTGPYMGTPLIQAFKTYDRFPPRSRYYQNWSIANGARPRARTRMSPKVFMNKIFRAFVRTAIPKHENGPLKGKPRHAVSHYSIVDELLEVVIGGSGQCSVESDQDEPIPF